MHQVENHKKNFPNLRIYNQSNKGLGNARNRGLSMSRGVFVIFIDSDDTISPGFLEEMVKTQALGNYDIVSCQAIKVWRSGCSARVSSRAIPITDPPLAEHEVILGQLQSSVATGRLYKRSLLIKNGGIRFPDSLPHEDLFFTWKVFRQAGRVAYNHVAIYYWRQREGSLSKTITKSHIDTIPALRRDTVAYLGLMDGTVREYALGASRNLTLTSSVYRRLIQQNVSGELVEHFFSTLKDMKPEIERDLKLVTSSKIKLRGSLKKELPDWMARAINS